MSCSMTRRSDAGEARNCGPGLEFAVFEYKMRSKQTLWNRAWPGTGPDFLAKHTAATHWYPSENMGIYMGVRKVWPFKCQKSENGPFIYFLY